MCRLDKPAHFLALSSRINHRNRHKQKTSESLTHCTIQTSRLNIKQKLEREDFQNLYFPRLDKHILKKLNIIDLFLQRMTANSTSAQFASLPKNGRFMPFTAIAALRPQRSQEVRVERSISAQTGLYRLESAFAFEPQLLLRLVFGHFPGACTPECFIPCAIT